MLTTSKLRENIYRILDQVLATGVPVEVRRHGKVLKIMPPEESRKLDRLPQRDYLKGDPEELVHLDWADEWRP